MLEIEREWCYSTYCTVASDVFIYVCTYSALYVCTYLVYKISPSSRRRKSHVMLFIHNELGQDRSGPHPQVCMPTMTQLKRLIKGFAKWLPHLSTYDSPCVERWIECSELSHESNNVCDNHFEQPCTAGMCTVKCSGAICKLLQW